MNANSIPWRVMSLPSQPGGLPATEITIAEALKPHGYATGMSGKWHMGVSNLTHEWAHLPKQHGYDTYLGIPFTNMEACKVGQEDPRYCMLMANNTIVEQPTAYNNLTEVLTNHAIKFINNSVAEGRPFFFFMSYVHVHAPLFTSPAFVNVSEGGNFGDNVMEMDASVGEIMAALDVLGIANDTLVFLISDNGPYAEAGWENSGRAGGLRGSKAQTFEGGIRVPGMARWPGHIPAGVVTDEQANTMDIFPTILSLAGVPLPADRIIDGLNITQLLLNPLNTTSPHQFMWHYCGLNVTAARQGRYKVHYATQIWQTDTRPSPLCVDCCPYSVFSFGGNGGALCDCAEEDLIRHDPPLMFDMVADPFEQSVLTPSNFPEFWSIVNSTSAALAQHYATVTPVQSQMYTLPVPELCPCCNGVNPKDTCNCGYNFNPN